MEEKRFSVKKQKRLALAALAICVLVMLLIAYFAGVPMIRYASEPERFRLWVDAHGIGGRLAYIGMVFLQIIVAIIPGEPLEILGGYAFGALEGTILYLIAAFTGSVVVFVMVRRLGVRLVEIFFTREKLHSLRFLKATPKRDLLFLVIFMIPGTPKDLLCYFAGLTDIRFSVWLIICSVGRIPALITSTIGGDALGTGSYLFAAAVFVITMLISGLGLLVYYQICKRHEEKH